MTSSVSLEAFYFIIFDHTMGFFTDGCPMTGKEAVQLQTTVFGFR